MSDGYKFSYTEEQTQAYLADFEDCLWVSGMKPKHEFTTEEWRESYEGLKKAAECLRSEGYEIPEAPSFDVYLESPIWTPYQYVAPITGVSPSEWRRLNKACPQSEFK